MSDSNKDPEIGDVMPDGSVYAGVSPDTGKAMYTTPRDAPLAYIFRTAMEYASRLYAHGYNDWRVPTKNELNVLFNNRAKIGGFNGIVTDRLGSYLTSTSVEGSESHWEQYFFERGNQVQMPDSEYVAFDSALRCVRG